MKAHYVILTRPDCSWCVKAKELMQKNDPDVEVKEFVVERPSQLRDYMLAMNMLEVPQIWWVEEDYIPTWIGGFNELEDIYNENVEVEVLDDKASD